ncbi:hypothetical protein PUN28_000002 [Cardiocondyla obscurior]|uniref:Reverse transcriptase n=2 Tax=Cardiocondyla obscurior TaxID=286306 RepID=A0AAW2E7Z4_9HYME
MLLVGNTPVQTSPYIKYLGLTLDENWTFGTHFQSVVPKAVKAAISLGHLMPNIGGPVWKARKLYATAVRSIILYGAPVWADELQHNRLALAEIRRFERRLAVRVARLYRTTATDAACILAGLPPLHLEAVSLARRYNFKKRIENQHRVLTNEISVQLRKEENQKILADWKKELYKLTNISSGHRVIMALRDLLPEWQAELEEHGTLDYRTAQIITGHGVFGDFLHRIGKEGSAKCWECGASKDGADHTLYECSAFTTQRDLLIQLIGPHVNLHSIMSAILTDPSVKSTFCTFCQEVISIKEKNETERRREILTRRTRRRRRPPAHLRRD